MADRSATLMIKTDTEDEVLAKIERIDDVLTKRALMSIFFWRLATQAVVAQPSTSST